MNFSAQKASRKWPCSGSAAANGNGYRCGGAADIWLASRSRRGGPERPVRRPGATFSAMSRPKARRAALPAPVPLPKPRPADAPPTGSDKPAAGEQTPAEADKAAEQAAPSAAAAHRLPVGPDGRDRHRPQHSRHPWRWRLRRRGSGAARGRGAAGQAPGFGKAGRNPPLRHGVSDCGLDPHRHGALGGEPRQRRQRPRQFRLVRVPRPQPRGWRQTVGTRSRQCARRSRA